MLTSELILSLFLFPVLIAGLILSEPLGNKENAAALSTPAYCIESHPDYDREKCETENPLYRWRRLQEERVLREAEWQKNGCKCSEIQEDDKQKTDPFAYSGKRECELACGINTQPQAPDDCNSLSAEYNKEECENDPLARWRRAQEEKSGKLWKERGCNCPAPAKDDESEDPLHRWERLQCERACSE